MQPSVAVWIARDKRLESNLDARLSRWVANETGNADKYKWKLPLLPPASALRFKVGFI